MSDTLAGANQEPVMSVSGALDLVTRTARDGAVDAREAAARTWGATSLFVCRFVYTTCYTISYGVVFPTAMIARSIPRDNAAVLGLIDGAQAAIHKVDQVHGELVRAHGADGAGLSRPILPDAVVGPREPAAHPWTSPATRSLSASTPLMSLFAHPVRPRMGWRPRRVYASTPRCRRAPLHASSDTQARDPPCAPADSTSASDDFFSAHAGFQGGDPRISS